MRHLREYGGDIQKWWADFRERPSFTKEADDVLLTVLGVSACFSADPDGRPRLPFDTATGRLLPEVWERWLDWDPVRMVERHADAVRSWHAVWIDAGNRDEWHLDIGAQAFMHEITQAGLGRERIHFETFDAGHGGIDYRYPLALAWLAHRISPAEAS